MPLPAPRTWDDGDDPDSIMSADDLNLDWRDSWDFLLGTSRPMILLHHTTGSVTVQTASQTTIPFDTEVLKRGGMIHDNVTNNSRIQVPYTGQYGGYLYLGVGTVSTTASKFTVYLIANGATQKSRGGQIQPPTTAGVEVHAAFTVELAAGDYVEMKGQGTGSTAPTATGLATRCKFAMWYEGDAS